MSATYDPISVRCMFIGILKMHPHKYLY